MVERQEVEALLEIVRGGTEQVCDRLGVAPGHTVYAVEVDTLAALCRAWLALDGAPVGHADTATDYGGMMWTEVHGLIDDDILAIDGQRVRIVGEVEEIEEMLQESPEPNVAVTCPDCCGVGRGGRNTTDGGAEDDCSSCSGEGRVGRQPAAVDALKAIRAYTHGDSDERMQELHRIAGQGLSGQQGGAK